MFTRASFRFAVVVLTLGAVGERVANAAENKKIAAPEMLTAQVISQGRVGLQWRDMSTDEQEFLVERGPYGAEIYERIGVTIRNATSFVDESPPSGSRFDYRVRARRGLDQSPPSNVATVVTPGKKTLQVPSMPVDVKLQVDGYSIVLSWKNLTPNKGVNILGKDGKTIGRSDPNAVKFVLANVLSSTLYEFTLMAFNDAGNSAPTKKYSITSARRLYSTGMYQPLAIIANHSENPLWGSINFPDPDDRSDMVFLEVSPSSLTVVAGEAAHGTVTVILLGSPRGGYLTMGGIPGGLGIDEIGLGGPMGTATSRNFTITTTTAVPPGTYEFYVFGLTNENKWTERAPFTLIVQAPPIPSAATANEGTVTIESTYNSIFTQGTYYLDGELLEVQALFDNENDHVVNVMPAGANYRVYPRFPRLTGSGHWTLDAGRGYAVKDGVTANLVVTALLDGQRFIAVHIHCANDGRMTPILFAAGDLENPGIVMSTDDFEIDPLVVVGLTPTADAPGFLRGTIIGLPMFFEPNLTGTIWADLITFTFDAPLLQD